MAFPTGKLIPLLGQLSLSFPSTKVMPAFGVFPVGRFLANQVLGQPISKANMITEGTVLAMPGYLPGCAEQIVPTIGTLYDLCCSMCCHPTFKAAILRRFNASNAGEDCKWPMTTLTCPRDLRLMFHEDIVLVEMSLCQV